MTLIRPKAPWMPERLVDNIFTALFAGPDLMVVHDGDGGPGDVWS